MTLAYFKVCDFNEKAALHAVLLCAFETLIRNVA
jgi:hypothetical protein